MKRDELLLRGQALIKQDSSIDDSPSHGFPSNSASILIVLVIICTPSPHSSEHSPTVQSPHSQST